MGGWMGGCGRRQATAPNARARSRRRKFIGWWGEVGGGWGRPHQHPQTPLATHLILKPCPPPSPPPPPPPPACILSTTTAPVLVAAARRSSGSPSQRRKASARSAAGSGTSVPGGEHTAMAARVWETKKESAKTG